MSSGSDSEEFYDAEENATQGTHRKPRKSSKDSLKLRANSEPNVAINTVDINNKKEDESSVFIEPQPKTIARKKFKEIRKRLHVDDEDCGGGTSLVTPPNSQTSSVDGVSAATNRNSHPFRIIEHDALSLQSLSSLGRVGRILGGISSDNASIQDESTRKTASASALSLSSRDSESTPSSSKDTSQYPSTMTLVTNKNTTDDTSSVVVPLQEPDVIASTKASCSRNNSYSDQPQNLPSAQDVPVAPPRRKKKNVKNSVSSLSLATSSSSSTFSSKALASPASTIESITREFEHSLDRVPSTKQQQNETKSSSLRSGQSLDIKEATRGQFVVKPQDTDNIKGVGVGVGFKHDNNGECSRVVENSDEAVAVATMTMTMTPTHKIGNGRRSSVNRTVGHYSLGPHRSAQQIAKGANERRKSAGDENMLKQMNLCVRTRTNSGKPLSDLEILEQVTVLNLDTGERVPLSVAEDKLPQCINPLSLHIMRLTSEYVSSSSMDKEKESDEESVDTRKSGETPMADIDDFVEMGRVRKRTAKLKRFLGSTVKKTMHKAKSIAQEVTHARHKEDAIDIIDSVHPGEHNIKLKASNSHKGPYDFEKVEHVQEFKDEHEGAIWCMKFSGCGRLLATAGQDRVLRIWIVRYAFPFFQDMRTKYNAEKVSPTPSQESIVSHHSADNSSSNLNAYEAAMLTTEEAASKWIFMPKPFCTYTGHTSDLLDVSWSKNYFLLSSSMDKTVRLWHISRKESLCCFQHIDFVTAIAFHPKDDRYFLSGSLDGKLRLWNIPDKKVAVWNEVEGNATLITAANFSQNGKFAVVGVYDGRCIFYNTDQLKYHTQINVRSSRGRNATGRKISGIEPMPGEEKILVTSNDSRIRLYDLRDLNVSCKYKGCVNTSSQIKASFSHDGKYIVSGSENRDIYIWKTNHDYSKFSSVRRDRNDFWEAIKAHNAVVTCAIFAPNPDDMIKMLDESEKRRQRSEDSSEEVKDPMVEQHTKGCGGYVLVSADFNGCIKVFVNKMKPKHSSLPASALT